MPETAGTQSAEPVRVLLVEDDPADALITTRMLPKSYQVTHVDTWDGARLEIYSHHHDVILLDLGLPDVANEALLAHALSEAQDIPIIIMTGRDDSELAVQAVRLGAQDYLVKGEFPQDWLDRAIRYAIERATIHKHLEETQRRQLELKDEFISHVSHELRTPLTAIHQFGGILRDEIAGPLTPDQKNYVGILMKNVNQLRDMIEDLMEATRAEVGKLVVTPTALRVEATIEETVGGLHQAATEKGLTIRTELAEGGARVLADDGRVRQVVANLVTNAIKFTPEGGEVEVGSLIDPEDPEFLRVWVKDTGRGIEPAALERIFERMHQEEDLEACRKGIGLGLYICKELVTRHGGRIWAQSVVDQGSTFLFTLPLFSVAGLLYPVVFPLDAHPNETVSLVTTRIRPLDFNATVPIQTALLDKAYEIHSDAVLRYGDALFPRSHGAGLSENFFIVAATQGDGVRSLVNRLTRAMARIGLDSVNAGFEVTAEVIEVPISGETDPHSRVRAVTEIVLDATKRSRSR